VKRYSEKSSCPKCGTVGARTEYFSGKDRFLGETKLPDEPEFLSRSCVRCGYTWGEAPLDATEAEGKIDEENA